MEYRFVGRRLVLLDAHGHIIVDFTDELLPGLRNMHVRRAIALSIAVLSVAILASPACRLRSDAVPGPVDGHDPRQAGRGSGSAAQREGVAPLRRDR